LWITFKICIFVIWNNTISFWATTVCVVNYFQNLYLCDSQQQRSLKIVLLTRCELLSKFVSLWFETTSAKGYYITYPLWITFKICIFVTSNNAGIRAGGDGGVVNYFQNLYLCDLKQPKIAKSGRYIRCELLSKFVFLWFETTAANSNFVLRRLWITFKICIFVIWNNKLKIVSCGTVVVNYFQNLYLCDSQQQYRLKVY